MDDVRFADTWQRSPLHLAARARRQDGGGAALLAHEQNRRHDLPKRGRPRCAQGAVRAEITRLNKFIGEQLKRAPSLADGAVGGSAKIRPYVFAYVPEPFVFPLAPVQPTFAQRLLPMWEV